MRIRLVLVAAATIFGALRVSRGAASGWLYLVAAAVLAVAFLREGPIWLAMRAYRRGDIAGVRRLTGQVSRADWLRPQSRAYYDWLQGVVAADAGDLVRARSALAAAAAGPLRTSNDVSVVHSLLAELALKADDRTSAAAHLAEARRRPHRAALDPALQALEQQLSQ